MNIIYKRNEVNSIVNSYKLEGKTVGFVPTMGALHLGHLQLVSKAISECDFVVCSIFVNPTQFNNPDDLINYPRTLDADIQKLESIGCHLVFTPDVDEMYQGEDEEFHYDFGDLSKVMEGVHRPGHFNGMATIVHKLLIFVPATKAYFGLKDYQQLLIVQNLVEIFSLPTEIVPCDIVRENDGLAMSSRNIRLNKPQRNAAPLIHQTLVEAANSKMHLHPNELTIWISDQINSNPELKVEYINIADGKTLKKIENWSDSNNPVIFAVVFAGEVRLIDNIQVK